MPSIYDITESDLKQMADDQIIVTRNRCHKIHRVDLVHVGTDHRLGKLLRILLKVHDWLTIELAGRGLPHGDCTFPTGAAKIRTSFGEFTRQLDLKAMAAIRISDADEKRIEQGDVSFVAVPWTSDNSKVLDEVGEERIVVLSTGPPRGVGSAIGTAQLIGPWNEISGKPDFTAFVIGSDEHGDATFKSAKLRFFPLVSAIRIKAPPGGVLPPGVIDADQVALEKRKSVEDIGTDDVTPDFVSEIPDGMLGELADELRDRARPFFEIGSEPEGLSNALVFVLEEAGKRNLKVEVDDPLDRAARRLSGMGKDSGRAGDPAPELDMEKIEFIHRNLPKSMVVIPNFVSISGSNIYPHKNGAPPNDMDVVYRCTKESLGLGGLLLKMERALKLIAGGVPIQHIACPEGSAWTSLHAYDLVLIKKPEADVEVVREDFARTIKQEREDGRESLVKELTCDA